MSRLRCIWHGGNQPQKEVIRMADKVKCRPERVGKKPGPKPVKVESHTRSKPKPIPRKCGK
jgi:hypothetical protein